MEKALVRRAVKGREKQRHAAVLLKGGRPLAWGVNKHGVHAEVAALRGVQGEGGGCTLLSLRLLPGHGELGMAAPCAACRAALIRAGVRKVRYTNRDGEWEEFFL